MTQEEKELLLKDLCARLPYGVLCKTDDGILPLKDVYINGAVGNEGQLKLGKFKYGGIYQSLDKVKLYLRPMSSMTTEEEYEYYQCNNIYYLVICEMKHTEMLKATALCFSRAIDWLNTHHFDYRGLIKKGLAIEAPEDMYNKKGENH